MQVRIKKNHSFPLEYQTSGACAFDFVAAETITIAPGEWKRIDTGTVVETPEGYVLLTAPRSSTYKNYSLMQVNSVGIIDQDYCGDDDTIQFPYVNMGNAPVTIQAGERIGQGMFVPILKPELVFVDTMDRANRGGFGSTGRA